MHGPYNATTIAKWFTNWANSAERTSVSNLKLQMILYHTQGHHLALCNTPLFDDEIQAWPQGPVVPATYREFENFGSNEDELDDFTWDVVDEKTTQLLMWVWNTYGGFATWRLRNMTHAEAPWKDNLTTVGHNRAIHHDSLRASFALRTKIPTT